MATLKEFEAALRQNGMTTALALLDGLRQRDRATRRAAPARRVSGRKMTPELAHRILDLHGATKMTQQEIAFQLGVNQGRVNEVIKHGKWLDGNAASSEAQSRDRALRKAKTAKPREVLARRAKAVPPVHKATPAMPRLKAAQLSFGDL